jgi:periplasmic divalent cation tolerance protein
MKKISDGAFLYSTWPDKESATRGAHAIVAERFAACANILGGMTAIYRWENKVETADEVVMIIKTTKSAAPAAIARLSELHPYETPVIAHLPVEGDSAAGFLAWLNDSVG